LHFYHALAIETSGRPGELLQLKIGDIEIQADAEGKLYAALDIGRYGKKNQSRIVGITEFALQYYQKYLSVTHPDPTNKNTFVFISREPSAQYRNVAISGDALRADYIAFRNKTIPKLLKSPDISEQDKKHLECAIEELEFLFDAKWKNRMLPQLAYANKKNKKEDTFFPLQNFMMRLGLKMRQDGQNIRNYITSGSCYVKFLLCFQKYSGEERERQKDSSRFLGHSRQPW
jgi:hypothetical protein